MARRLKKKHCRDGRHKWMPKGIFKCTEVYNGERTPDSKLEGQGCKTSLQHEKKIAAAASNFQRRHDTKVTTFRSASAFSTEKKRSVGLSSSSNRPSHGF